MLELFVVVGEEAKVLVCYIYVRISAESALLLCGFLAAREGIFIDLLLAVIG
jgi:hypothetical protein